MKKYRGIFVALITPFKNGEIDWEVLGSLLEFYISSGVAGVVPCGTTGESNTLTHREHEQVIRYTIDKVRKRIFVVAGTGSNNTVEAISLTRYAEEAGADAALVVSPYYNKPTEEGIYRHYQSIAEQTTINLLIYNIPSRTGSNLNVDLVKRLASIPHVKGIKEGAGDIQQMIDMVHFFKESDFSVLTGEDTLLFDCCTHGGDGGIMTVAGVIPRQLVQLYDSISDGKLSAAQAMNKSLRPLVRALFIETNPIPVKYALSKLFNMAYEVRLPLTPLKEIHRELISKLLEELIGVRSSP